MKVPFKFKGVDLKNGTTFFVDGVDDLENNAIVIICRNCNEEYSWDKGSSTEDEWTSGMCKKCLLNEQNVQRNK